METKKSDGRKGNKRNFADISRIRIGLFRGNKKVASVTMESEADYLEIVKKDFSEMENFLRNINLYVSREQREKLEARKVALEIKINAMKDKIRQFEEMKQVKISALENKIGELEKRQNSKI